MLSFWCMRLSRSLSRFETQDMKIQSCHYTFKIDMKEMNETKVEMNEILNEIEKVNADRSWIKYQRAFNRHTAATNLVFTSRLLALLQIPAFHSKLRFHCCQDVEGVPRLLLENLLQCLRMDCRSASRSRASIDQPSRKLWRSQVHEPHPR